jgi:phage terminase large subunit
MSIKIDFSNLDKISNPIYLKHLTDFRRYQIYKGGSSAGKSVSIADNRIYNIIVNKGFNGLVIRNTGRDNHYSTFPELLKSINRFSMADLFIVNHSKGAEEITCRVNGNKIIFKGLDDVEKVKSTTFETGDLIWIWIEEASEITEDDFNQLDLRLRGDSIIPKHIILSFNPIDIDSWLKSRFFDVPIDPLTGFICQTTYHDNCFLSDIDKQIIESYKDKDYDFYKVYALNEWGSRSSNRVFHNLAIEDFEVKEENFSNKRQGIDFGFNHANAYIKCGFRDAELYIYKEVYAKNQLNQDFIKAVDAEGADKRSASIGDSAEPDKISEFSIAGFLIRGAMKGLGSLMNGINYLKGLPKIHIHKTLCPNAAREFVRMKYRKLKDGAVLEEVVEIDDDTIAATRYATEEFHPRKKTNITINQRMM